MKLDIIVPVFNEEKVLPLFIARTEKVCQELLSKKYFSQYSLIFTDDGSEDQTWDILMDNHKRNNNIKGIRFSRNFGHQLALKAGLDHSNGEVVVSMDGDLQHPPELIEQLLLRWKDGYKIVNTIRKDTEGINIFKKISSRMFYFLINLFSDVKIHPGSSDFRLLDKKVVDEIKIVTDKQIFLRGLVNSLGFNKTEIGFVADDRAEGKTKYTFKKMLKLALSGIMSFSIKPLRIITFTGIFVSFIAFIFIIYVLLARFMFNVAVQGWASIMISILFLGGVQLLSLGILGEYIGKMFNQQKSNKNYIVRDIL